MKMPARDSRSFCRNVAVASWPAGARRAPAAAGRRQGALAPHRAVYDLKLSKTRGKRVDRGGARPHPLRFLRQRLRRLRAAIPPGVRTRHRRGQGRAERPALDHLGGRRGQDASASIRRTRRRAADRHGRRPAPNATAKRSPSS